MYKTLASAMFWEGMEKDINWYVKRCSTCQKYKKDSKEEWQITAKICYHDTVGHGVCRFSMTVYSHRQYG